MAPVSEVAEQKEVDEAEEAEGEGTAPRVHAQSTRGM